MDKRFHDWMGRLESMSFEERVNKLIENFADGEGKYTCQHLGGWLLQVKDEFNARGLTLMDCHRGGQAASRADDGRYHTLGVEDLNELKMGAYYARGWLERLAWRCGFEREYRGRKA